MSIKRFTKAKFFGKVSGMIVTFHGNKCFRLQSGETSLVVDPETARFKANLTLFTESDDAHLTDGGHEEIRGAGEYEVQSIEVAGVRVPGEKKEKGVRTAYALQWEDLRIAILGCLSSALPVEVLDRLGEVDVLFLCVGGKCLDGKTAAGLVKKIAPAAVLPALDKKDSAEFLRAMDQKPKAQEKFTFKKKELKPEAQEVVILEAK